jgi:hypothetical protein
MTAPGRLQVASDGRVTGPARITHNTPWPCVNGNYGSGAMMGVVMHTMVGDLPGTTTWFNNPSSKVSAHFGIAQDGQILQYGPIGKSWCAWHAMAANLAWYGIEHADNGNPANPLTEAQIVASAQLLECLSEFAGFPLQVTNSVDVKGYGTHAMGGPSWGGHTCPGPGPRAQQRYTVVEVAGQIRRNAPKPEPKPAGLEGILVVLPGGTARKVLSGDGGKSWK